MEYAIRGYQGMESERPAYESSSVGMAFQCGVWCRDNKIPLGSVKASRGYTWIVNGFYKLNYKNNFINPEVTRI